MSHISAIILNPTSYMLLGTSHKTSGNMIYRIRNLTCMQGK